MKKVSAAQPKKPAFNAKAYVRAGLSQSEILEIKQSFDMFDTEGTGSIDAKQIKQAMQGEGLEVKNQAIYQLICDMEADGAGSISFEDFLHLMTGQVTAQDSRETFRKVFALFDDEKTGFVSVKALRRICKELDQDIPEYEIQDMIARADADKDGLVSEEEFYQIMTGKEV